VATLCVTEYLKSNVLRNRLQKCLPPSLMMACRVPNRLKNVGMDEFDHNLVIISLGGHSLDPFKDIIHSYKNILKPKRWREGSHEVDTLNVKDFKN
jgi:hypothetical protein